MNNSPHISIPREDGVRAQDGVWGILKGTAKPPRHNPAAKVPDNVGFAVLDIPSPEGQEFSRYMLLYLFLGGNNESIGNVVADARAGNSKEAMPFADGRIQRIRSETSRKAHLILSWSPGVLQVNSKSTGERMEIPRTPQDSDTRKRLEELILKRLELIARRKCIKSAQKKANRYAVGKRR